MAEFLGGGTGLSRVCRDMTRRFQDLTATRYRFFFLAYPTFASVRKSRFLI